MLKDGQMMSCSPRRRTLNGQSRRSKTTLSGLRCKGGATVWEGSDAMIHRSCALTWSPGDRVESSRGHESGDDPRSERASVGVGSHLTSQSSRGTDDRRRQLKASLSPTFFENDTCCTREQA